MVGQTNLSTESNTLYPASERRKLRRAASKPSDPGGPKSRAKISRSPPSHVSPSALRDWQFGTTCTHGVGRVSPPSTLAMPSTASHYLAQQSLKRPVWPHCESKCQAQDILFRFRCQADFAKLPATHLNDAALVVVGDDAVGRHRQVQARLFVRLLQQPNHLQRRSCSCVKA